jgi:hypothetical protein
VGCLGVGLILAVQVANAVSANAFSISAYEPSTYSGDTGAMDSALGITSRYRIEDFEDTELVPGLTISMSGNGVSGSLTALPAVLTLSSRFWDGTRLLGSNTANTNPSAACVPCAMEVMFTFSTPMASVGIGLSGFQSLTPPAARFPVTNHRLLINGVAVGATLEQLAGSAWAPDAFSRSAYIRIDAAPGESITSITFANITAPDFLEFDHLAMLPLPEPGPLALLMLGVGGLLRIGRRRGVAGVSGQKVNSRVDGLQKSEDVLYTSSASSDASDRSRSLVDPPE